MHIYLRHPDHGTKVATMDLEAIYDEENAGYAILLASSPARRRTN
jgi:hypothetical protein